MPADSNPNQLFVEGHDDLYSIVELVKARITWPKDRAEAPVFIDAKEGRRNILKASFFSTTLKDRTIQNCGIVLDADDNPTGCYRSVRDHCAKCDLELPSHLPKDGLIVQREDNKQFGLWIMPDNTSIGMLETFLKCLIPDWPSDVWQHAEKSVAAARELGANCKDSDLEKAHLYTWLAWYDEPGQSPGTAIKNKLLINDCEYAKPFLSWFLNLYGLVANPQKVNAIGQQ